MAHDTSNVQASNTSAIACGMHGYDAWNGSTISTHGATATSPVGSGFTAWGGSALMGGQMTVTDCGETGIALGTGSYGSSWDVSVVGCDGDGISVARGSFFEAGSSDVEEGLRSRSNANGRHGLHVNGGSYAAMSGLQAAGNRLTSVDAGALSGVEVNGATLSGSLEGLGLSVVGTSWVSASQSLIENNFLGGVNCAGSSFCTVSNSVVRDNIGMTGQYVFGLNVFWDGWLDVTGTVSTGHPYDTNMPRESQPEDWGPIYDGSVPLPVP
jgi:hypothetical protein